MSNRRKDLHQIKTTLANVCADLDEIMSMKKEALTVDERILVDSDLFIAYDNAAAVLEHIETLE